jgi:hypothetical protein
MPEERGFQYYATYAVLHTDYLTRMALSTWLGLDVSLGGEDRRVLERTILPAFAARDELQRVLFVGCEWYTKFYPKLFPGRDFCTIDFDPVKSKWGAPTHVVGSFQDLARHFPASRFDLIVCNGVLSFGIDNRADAEAAFAGCSHCLRDGGLMMLGWSDAPEHRPKFRLEDVDSMKAFVPYVFPPLAAAEHRVYNRWQLVYRFYEKKA